MAEDKKGEIRGVSPEDLAEIAKNVPETERLREQRLEFEASDERMKKLDESIRNYPLKPLPEETK